MEHLDNLKHKLKLSFEQNRLETFENKWIYDDTKICNSKALAEAGFYFCDSNKDKDLVQCFYCNKPLVSWEENDEPWEEHRKRSPNCEFVKMGKAENMITLQEFLQVREKLIKKTIKYIIQNYTEEVNETVELCNNLKKILEK